MWPPFNKETRQISFVSMVSGARFAEIVENEHGWPLCVSPWILNIEIRHRPETSSPMLRVLNIAEGWQDEQSQNKSMPALCRMFMKGKGYYAILYLFLIFIEFLCGMLKIMIIHLNRTAMRSFRFFDTAGMIV